jgi:RNA-binding protein
MSREVPHQNIEASVAVGKSGVTDQVIAEIQKQLKKKRIIKIKLHGESKIGRTEIAKELASRSGANLVEVRGFTVVVTRKKQRL